MLRKDKSERPLLSLRRAGREKKREGRDEALTGDEGSSCTRKKRRLYKVSRESRSPSPFAAFQVSPLVKGG